MKKVFSILALLLPLIVGEVQAQKSLPSKHGFEQNGKSANARGSFGQNRKSANAREVQSATTAKTPSRRSVLRATSTDALAPTDVTASGITGASATVSWNGTGDSYNLRYRKSYRKIIFSEGFESCSHGGLPAGWTALDADGDGHSWFAYDYTNGRYDDNGNPNSFDNMCVESESYLHETGPLTPDNWLISPQVPLEGKLSLWAKGVDPAYAAEHFAIYLSTTGKDVADFTTVLIPETEAQGVYTEYTADLSAYAGQVGYIAIRHFNVTDMYQLAVDNITITDDWVEVDGVTSPYTLDGLDDLSIYEVEVQAVTGEQQSSWSSTLRFYTLRNATILYHQNFDDTNDINELGWTFVDNDGDGRNWTMSINGKYDNDIHDFPSETSTSVPNSLYSQSFTDDGYSSFDADNWAITPAIEIYESSILSFQLAYGNPEYADKVGVYVGETANVNEMTEVLAPTSFTRTAKRQFNEETVDLSAFAGKTCYIAFRHQDYDKWIVFIDDVIVYTTATYDLTLAETDDNSTTLSENNGKLANVTLKRTLQTGGWNTFCAPFSTATPSGWTVKELSSSAFDSSTGELTLNFGNASGIEAGKPYLVKVTANVENPTFNGVTISNTTTMTETTAVDFVPVMNPTSLTGGDANDILFVGSGNTLLHPTALPANMKGFRAYFLLKGEAALARAFRMDFGDGETTGIISIENAQPATSSAVYDLQGRRINGTAQKGVYIVNGKKTVIK